MRGLEERLRLALEGTETGFWEWDVATDTVEWSDNMGPLYGLPRGTQPAGVNDFLERIVHPDDREALARADRGARSRDGTAYEFDLRVALPDRGERWLHTRARAVRGPDGRTERITGLLSDVTERRHREEAHAFLDAASQVLAASMDPVAARSRRSRSSPSRGSPTGARCSSPTRRAARRRARRPRQGPLGARAAGALPAGPGRADRRAERDPHRPLGALPGDRLGADGGGRARRRAASGSCATCR